MEINYNFNQMHHMRLIKIIKVLCGETMYPVL